MKKIIIPVKLILLYLVVSIPLIGLFLYIAIYVKGPDKDWDEIPIIYLIIAAFCNGIPLASLFVLPRIEIDLKSRALNILYLTVPNVSKFNYDDFNGNWRMNLNEILSIEVVRLTSEEKKKYKLSKFKFNKFLKVKMFSGNITYVYISPYSNGQIKELIKFLNK